jgi:hypothetical protein
MDDDRYILNPDYVLTDNEIGAYDLIREQFSGLSLQQSYNVVSAAKGYLDVIGDNVDDFDNFIFD